MDINGLPTKTSTIKTALGPTTYERIIYVDPYPGRDGEEVLEESSCPRCGGLGEIAVYRFIDNGRCFECDGIRTYRTYYRVNDARRELARVVDATNASTRYMLKARAASEVAWAEALAARPEWSRAKSIADEDHFIGSLVDRLDEGKTLSEKQISAGADAIARHFDRKAARAAEQEAAEPVVEGRIEITGEVLTTKYTDGYYGSTKKMLVRDDRGFKVWGTVPESLDRVDGILSSETVLKAGQRVKFTAQVEASSDDPKFGFFKRPSKAVRLDG